MKYHFLLFLILPLLSSAQNFAVGNLPAELTKNADAVIRDHRIDFTVTAPGQATKHEYRAVTIFNENTHYNMMVVHYSPYNKVKRITGKVYDANGNLIRQLKKNEIRDQSAISSFSIYEDDRYRYVEVEHGSYPFTVEFEYEMTYSDLLSYPMWSVDEFGVGVEHAALTITVPQGIKLLHKTINVEAEAQMREAGNNLIYQWKINNLPPVVKEPYAPSAPELLPFVMASPTVFEAEGYTGSMANWQTFGQFMGNLIKGQDELSPAMKSKVAELTAGATTEEEKINVLYKYMQENMRYVSVQLGIGGWRPFSAQYVEENKYGDCKALSNFMMSMLKEVGIRSYPVLIAAGNSYFEVTEDFTKPLFNHMILHVPSVDYWLECTSNTAPPNYLGSFTADRNAMLVTETGGELARTPQLTKEDNRETSTTTITLSETGEATIHYEMEAYGERQDWWRGASDRYSKEKFDEQVYKMLNLTRFTLQDIEVKPDPDQPKCDVSFKAQVPKYATKSGKRLFVPMNPIDAYTFIPSADDERIHPVVRKRASSQTARITIQLPNGFHVESLPTVEPIETPYGKYSIQFEKGAEELTIERTLEIHPIRIPAEQYDEWRDFYKKIGRAEGGKLVLVNKS